MCKITRGRYIWSTSVKFLHQFPQILAIHQRDILNMSVNFIYIKCLYKVMPHGENKLLFRYYKRLKTTFLSFLASWLCPNTIKNRLREHHCIIWRPAWCIGCSATKRIRDDMTICWCLTLRDFLQRITAYQTAGTKFAAVMVFKTIMDGL